MGMIYEIKSNINRVVIVNVTVLLKGHDSIEGHK
jgi:hypothetical protein